MSDVLQGRAEAWAAADPDPTTAAELRGLLARGDRAELEDRFSGALEFGTAGLRGVLGAGPNRMNRAVVRRTTAGLARYLKAQIPGVQERGVVVGRDGRRLSHELAEDTARVLAAEGIRAWVFAPMVPTPVTAFACLRLRAAAAVMVTASHNPPEYNGYKVYWSNGAQIIPPHDEQIAAAIDAVEPAKQVQLLDPSEARVRGLWTAVPASLEQEYLDALLAERIHPGPSELRVVYTALHGVGGRFVVELLRRAGFARVDVVAEQQEPDGAFPTVRFPNPEEPGALELVLALAEARSADLVLANDPDADRLAVAARDRAGAMRVLNGNEVGVLLGHYLLTQRQPPPARPLVITTIVSSAQLKQIAADLGAGYGETLTGFKWVANHALERAGERFVFGYEEALGYTVGTVTRDKDGIGAALLFAEVAAWCRGRGVTPHDYLEEIQRRHGLFVARQLSFTFPGAAGVKTIEGVMTAFRERPPTEISGLPVAAMNDYQLRQRRGAGRGPEALSLPRSNVLSYELEGGSRVTLRPSGTEPKLKLYLELKELPAPGQSIAEASARATARLDWLTRDFLSLSPVLQENRR